MPTYFQKPENALKRANEFIEVGKPEQALDVLYDVIKSKRHRVWQKIHEPIMLLYLQLCVDLKKSHLAKEGLYQYKNICQAVNVKSLDIVVRKYLELAESKTEAARAESQQTVDVDDLDVLQTPESLLLAAVTAEDAQDRSDRAILTPWVKFLWESYRQCLDLLRNNNRVERLYHDIAKQAFEFCQKYARKTEFRKLCDNLRNHLKQIVEKQYTQQNAVSLNNPDSLSFHLETRLAQLDFSISMELWQEAFKAVEDIHDLIVRSKKQPRPSLMANYFENVSLVFMKSGNRLFHAAACHRLFLLVSEHKKNPSPEEIAKMANRVLCATLSIPLPPSRFSIDQLLESNESEKKRHLAFLLNLPSPPTRASLVKDLARYNVLQNVSPELKEMYSSLETEFDPLHLSSKMTKCIAFVGQQDDLLKYVAPLQGITVVRLVKQVAQIYQTIQFSRLRELVPFVSAFELERVVVQAAKNIELPVRMDHKNQTVSFGTDLNVSRMNDSEDGPFLQHMPGDQLRSQLQLMAKALSSAIDKLNANESVKKSDQELKMRLIDTFRKNESRDREKILKRRTVIECRKEMLERVNMEKDEAELAKERDKEKKLRKAEEERLRREAEERERQRAAQERENIRKKEAEKRIEQLKQTDVGIRALEGLTEEELKELDTDEILRKQVEQLEKEKRELQERLKAQEKKVDYFIRAKRLAEIPLLKEHAKELSVSKKEQFESQEAERIEALKKEREIAMKHRDRLRRMMPDKVDFVSKLQEARQDDYSAKLEQFNKHLADVRAERLAERKEARKVARREKAIRDREEQQQRERDELLRKEREERIRRENEEKEAHRKEEEERLAKLEAIAAKQRQREAEIEAKISSEQPAAQPFRARQEGGGWRAREEAKKSQWMKKDALDEEDGGGWRRGGADRDLDRGTPRDRDMDRRGPSRDSERGPDRGPSRDFERSSDRGPSRDFERSSDRGPSKGDRDARGPPARDFDRNAPRGGDREFERGPPRGSDRDYERGPPREKEMERGPPRGGRDFGNRDDGPWQRGAVAETRRGGDRRDFGGPRDRDDKWRRDDDGGMRREREGDREVRRDDREIRRGDGEMRRGGPPRDRPRDDGGAWRRGDKPPARRNEDGPRDNADADGWSTVRYK